MIQPPQNLRDSHAASGSHELECWLRIESPAELAERVAHDLIQPLNEIVTQVWLCRESLDNVSSEAEESLAGIESQAMRAAGMIRTARRLVDNWRLTHGCSNGTGGSDTVS